MRASERTRELRPTVPGSLMSRLVEMAGSPDGVTQRDAGKALGIDAISAQSLVKDGVKRGRLFRATKRLGHMVRFFARPEDAAAYWSQPRKPDMPNSRAVAGRLHDIREPIRSTAHNRPGAAITLAPSFPVRRKGEARPAPVTIIRDTRRPEGEAQVPAHVLPAYGVAAGYDPRYQVGPGDEVPSFYRAVPLGAAHMLPGVR